MADLKKKRKKAKKKYEEHKTLQRLYKKAGTPEKPGQVVLASRHWKKLEAVEKEKAKEQRTRLKKLGVYTYKIKKKKKKEKAKSHPSHARSGG